MYNPLLASKYNANLFRAYLADCDSCFDFSAWARSSEEVEGVFPSLVSPTSRARQRGRVIVSHSQIGR